MLRSDRFVSVLPVAALKSLAFEAAQVDRVCVSVVHVESPELCSIRLKLT